MIDVDPEHRRRGFAPRLIELAAQRAADAGAYQMRGWTSDTPLRAAALELWRALGFAICPTDVAVGEETIHGCFVARRLAEQ